MSGDRYVREPFLYGGRYVWEPFCQFTIFALLRRTLCPGSFMSGGLYVRGLIHLGASFVQLRGTLYPGNLCPGPLCVGAVLFRRLFVLDAFYKLSKRTTWSSILQNSLNIGARFLLPRPHPRTTFFHVETLPFYPPSLSPCQTLKRRP